MSHFATQEKLFFFQQKYPPQYAHVIFLDHEEGKTDSQSNCMFCSPAKVKVW